MKKTQCEAILAYLRKHKKATNMELVTNLRIASPWKRIDEINDPFSYRRLGQSVLTLYVARSFIKTPSGKRVVQYRLERV